MKQKLFAELSEANNFRAEAFQQGVPALYRLIEIARQNTGQSAMVRRFLLGCYNGSKFPFDLTNFRTLDLDIYKDCIAVLNLDSSPKKEIQEYIENGSELFNQWASNIINTSD